jgi:signal transduction histidine kinase/CheY-like chemotaxis protein
MKLKDLNIGTQLKIGLGFILALVVVLAAVAWEHADRLWLQTKGLHDHPHEVRKAIGALKSDILTIHWGLDELFEQENPQEPGRILPLIEACEVSAEKQFGILFERYLGPRSDIENLRQAVDRCRDNRKEVLRLLQAGDTNKARLVNIHEQSGLDSDHTREINALLNVVDDFARARSQRFYQDADTLQRSLSRQLGLVVAVILLLSVLVFRFLSRSIRKPLAEMTDAAERFRAGDQGARSRYVSANEFGTLSAGFNALAETVQSELRSRAAAARIAGAMLREEELHAFCRELLKGLMAHTGSQLGAVYLRNHEKTAFDHFESIGLAPAGRASFSATDPEGEFGAALATGQVQHLADIPADARFTFATAGGEFQPREIFTMPIPGDEGFVAVISLAGVRAYPAPAVRLVNDIWNLITARLNGVVASERIRAFAERIERQNEELQAQQEELVAQAEELRKQTEELQAQNVELEQQQRAVEEASRLKSQFLSTMSHELRTPLNSVMALSRVLMLQARTKLTEEEVSYIEIIERNGKNLLRLINDILDLAKIEAGRMDIHPKPFALGQAVESLLENISPLAREKQLEIRQEIPKDLPPLESDEIHVAQILQNLLANAVKFTDTGSLSVSVHSDPERVYVRIADTGIGIAEADLPHIFDEFRQVDGTPARRHEGTGLGLAIARKAAQMLGGEIAVESAPGRGSTFTLTLPLAWPVAAPLHEAIAPRPPSGAPSEREPILGGRDEDSLPGPGRRATPPSPRILLVEDNESAIIQVKAVLECTGHTVAVARGGQEAIDYVAHTIPDGIILDLMMPGMDGFAVLERIRGTAATSKIPVLILTARDLTPDDLKRLSANHVQQLVQKGDVDRETLLRKIRVMVGREGLPGV